jgi:hypothetical protein
VTPGGLRGSRDGGLRGSRIGVPGGSRVGAGPRVFLAVSLAATACAGNGGRDVVPESHDVVTDTRASPQGAQGYEYVARRPLAVVALAEARGLESITAHAAVDRLADRLDACITDKAREGGPVEGAARVIAKIDASGAVAATQVRVDPGAASASNAVVCLVAPMKLLTFPPADADGRGIAIEAIWGRVATPAAGP